MRVVTKHGLSVLNRRYQSVLIKCLLAGTVFLPRAANADLNFDPETGILKVDQNSTLDNSYSVNKIAFDASEKFVLDGKNNSLSAGDSGSIKISEDGILQDLTMVGTVTGTGGNTATVAGKVTFDNATISNINLDIMNGANLVMNGTMQGGKLSGGASAYSEGGIFNNVDMTTFSGIAKNATFKKYGSSFAFNDKVRFDGTTTIYADNVSGYYKTAYDTAYKNRIFDGETLILKSSDGNGAGTWNLDYNDLWFMGGTVQGNLQNSTLSFYNENSVFSGSLKDVTIEMPPAESWNWNGNIQIDRSSENVTLLLGDGGAEARPRTLNLTADANNISKVTINSNTTVNGNGHTLMANELYLSYFNAYFNNVKIKSNGDFSVTTNGRYDGNVLNLTNSSLSAANSITAGNINVTGTLDVDLYATTGNTIFSADKITGENGAKITFRTSGKSSDGTVYFAKNGGERMKFKDVSLNFSGTNAIFNDNADFTNVRISTTQRGAVLEFQNTDTVFSGNNTIVADNVKNKIYARVDKDSSLTLRNLDGTGNGLLSGGLLTLHGTFTGDFQGNMKLTAGENHSFNGKFDGGDISVEFTNSDLFDTTKLNFAQGSTINTLLFTNTAGITPRMIVNSDISVKELHIANNDKSLETAAWITGTGTLKTDKIYPYDMDPTRDLTIYFDGINIAALNDNLDFTGVCLGKSRLYEQRDFRGKSHRDCVECGFQREFVADRANHIGG